MTQIRLALQLLLTFVLCSTPAALAAVDESCVNAVSSRGERLRLLQDSEKADPPGLTRRQRRLKVLTSGLRVDTDGTMDPREAVIDTADPSAPFFLTLPNGKRVARIYLSGLRYIQADTLEELLRGGIHKVHRIRGFYADGTELTGLYHEDSFPWDPELHVLEDGSLIGHGGLIPQTAPGQIPKVREHNRGRTRMWAHVKFVEIAPGQFEEQWHFQGSLFGHLPTHDRWIGPAHFHNYGATFFRDAAGNYIRDHAGNYFMIYEAVTEEKDGLPWNTEVFAIKVDPTMTKTVGSATKVIGTFSTLLGRPFRASEREGGRKGYLLEGGRPVPLRMYGKLRWVVALSGGDYVSTRYGVHLAMSASEDPLSAYTPVTGASGELTDFAQKLRCLLNATWGPARAALFYDHSGALWMNVHFISQDQIPDGEVKDGWPTSAEEFVTRHRRMALVPVKIQIVNGMPRLELDAKDADENFRRALKKCVPMN